jgi:hypothetical protein
MEFRFSLGEFNLKKTKEVVQNITNQPKLWNEGVIFLCSSQLRNFVVN